MDNYKNNFNSEKNTKLSEDYSSQLMNKIKELK